MNLVELVNELNRQGIRLTITQEGKVAAIGKLPPEMKMGLAEHADALAAVLNPTPVSSVDVAPKCAVPTQKPSRTSSAFDEDDYRVYLNDPQGARLDLVRCEVRCVIGIALQLSGFLWLTWNHCLASTTPIEEQELGCVVHGFSAVLPKQPDVTLHVDLVNAAPRPFLEAYLRRGDTRFSVAKPVYALDKVMRLEGDGNRYWLTLYVDQTDLDLAEYWQNKAKERRRSPTMSV